MSRLAAVVLASVVAVGGVPLVSASPAAATHDASDVSVVRYGGADRYETSLEVAEAVAADAGGSLEWVLLVSGRRWTDAVVAAPVAGALGSPVLMTPPDELRADALEFLQRVGVSKVLVVGPNASDGEHDPGRGVGTAVFEALEEAGITAERVAGDNRFGTGVAAARRVTPGPMGDLGRTAIIASGEVFADALVAGPFAARGVHPVLLTPPDELHADVAAYLDEADIEHAALMGGTAALSAAVEQSIKDLGIEVTRVAGSTRYDTAAKAAELAEDRYSTAAGRPCFDTATVGLARARVPFDSFSAAPLLGRLCAPLLLADPDTVPTDTAIFLDAAREEHDTVRLQVFGGDAAISQAAINTYLSPVSTAPLWTLSGTVDHGWSDPLTSGRDIVMASDIEGAVVEITDGPNAGRQTVTDERGRWALRRLEQARVTVRVTAKGFAPAKRTLDLTADTDLPFAVSRKLPSPDASVEFPDTDPDYIRSVVPFYPHVHRVGNVRVFSDISPEFSRRHAEHGWKVWAFFDELYAVSPNDYLDAYYTTDSDVIAKLGTNCGVDTVFAEYQARDTRVVFLCHPWLGSQWDYGRWFIIPFQIPDFGTQLHEFGHHFFFETWPGTRSDRGWFIEGTAMYFEAGVFGDSLRIADPLDYCTVMFDRADKQDHLIPVGELITLEWEAFWADPHRFYPLSCMLFHYVELHHPGVLYSMIDQINSRGITTSDQLIDALLRLTGMSVRELNDAWVAYSRDAVNAR